MELEQPWEILLKLVHWKLPWLKAWCFGRNGRWFCWKVMEGFPIWILLEFGVVSIWTKRGFHCWNIMKIIFLDLVEDISLFYRCQDVRCQWCLLLHLDRDGFVRQISIARIKHSSTFAPFFICLSLLEFPQFQSLQLRFVENTFFHLVKYFETPLFLL